MQRLQKAFLAGEFSPLDAENFRCDGDTVHKRKRSILQDVNEPFVKKTRKAEKQKEKGRNITAGRILSISAACSQNTSHESIPPACSPNKSQDSIPPACSPNKSQDSIPPACSPNKSQDSIPPACSPNKSQDSIPPACFPNKSQDSIVQVTINGHSTCIHSVWR